MDEMKGKPCWISVDESDFKYDEEYFIERHTLVDAGLYALADTQSSMGMSISIPCFQVPVAHQEDVRTFWVDIIW